MRSRFDPWADRLSEREQRSRDATEQYMVWARKEGKAPLPITVDLRDWVLVIACVTHHAANLVVENGDPELLITIAATMSQQLREVLGQAETERLLALMGTMMTGIE